MEYAACSYLVQSRRALLTVLPAHHPMRERTDRNGVLRQTTLPVIPRPPFTDAEIIEIKRRRNQVASDPDDASSQLQRSQLVNMWNADYDQEEQWEDYDQAQPIMEERREYSGLPDAAFQCRDIVRERKRRVVSNGHEGSSSVRQLDGGGNLTNEVSDLEDGEIDENFVQSIEQENQQLQAQNEALRRMIDVRVNSSPPEAPPSPPESDTSESSNEGVAESDTSQSSYEKVAVDNRPGASSGALAETAQDIATTEQASSMEYLGPSAAGSPFLERGQQQ
ncbi:hypothetical protein LTR70_009557 [Exophiala xenobiotica]|uniref:Uncharacterized protein n=1 Tax=Lithohypha guttulata TaxID=1690604 RepID=A0ABR0JWZ5_9EURO|nr:hypothetical protein LTR24_009449 [Lithohypha guttulata]KAK5310338.1 hypothetical protein LTR70_009557 [Exophiala xenobiotica]